MAIITTGLNPAFLLEGATKAFGDAYDQNELLYPKMFEVRKSDRAYEEDALLRDLGLATKKAEGTAITYDDARQQWVKRYAHDTYATGFIVTMEAMEDNKAPEVVAQRARGLKLAQVRRRETVAANVLNNGFDSNYAQGDAKELLATDHPSDIGNQSNELATAADISEASLEQLMIDIRKAKDTRGNRIHLRPKMLIVPPDLEPEAFRILESSLRSGTADNDANFLRGRMPGGVVVNPYLTDTDAFFVKTDANDGLIHYERRPMSIELENDFDTSNVRFKSVSRYSFGASDWRGVYGSPGA